MQPVSTTASVPITSSEAGFSSSFVSKSKFGAPIKVSQSSIAPPNPFLISASAPTSSTEAFGKHNIFFKSPKEVQKNPFHSPHSLDGRRRIKKVTPVPTLQPLQAETESRLFKTLNTTASFFPSGGPPLPSADISSNPSASVIFPPSIASKSNVPLSIPKSSAKPAGMDVFPSATSHSSTFQLPFTKTTTVPVKSNTFLLGKSSSNKDAPVPLSKTTSVSTTSKVFSLNAIPGSSQNVNFYLPISQASEVPQSSSLFSLGNDDKKKRFSITKGQFSTAANIHSRKGNLQLSLPGHAALASIVSLAENKKKGLQIQNSTTFPTATSMAFPAFSTAPSSQDTSSQFSASSTFASSESGAFTLTPSVGPFAPPASGAFTLNPASRPSASPESGAFTLTSAAPPESGAFTVTSAPPPESGAFTLTPSVCPFAPPASGAFTLNPASLPSATPASGAFKLNPASLPSATPASGAFKLNPASLPSAPPESSAFTFTSAAPPPESGAFTLTSDAPPESGAFTLTSAAPPESGAFTLTSTAPPESGAFTLTSAAPPESGAFTLTSAPPPESGAFALTSAAHLESGAFTLPSVAHSAVPQESGAFTFTSARSSAPAFSFKASLQKASSKSPYASSSGSESTSSIERKSLIGSRTKNRNLDESNKIGEDADKMKDFSLGITELKSIICKGIHADINRKEVVLEYFSQFGKVKKVSCSKRNEYTVIEFENHASAENAKRNGTKISSRHDPVTIFWCQSTTKKEKTSSKRSAKKVDDVSAELEAMLEGSEDHRILSRPTETAMEGTEETVMNKHAKPAKPRPPVIIVEPKEATPPLELDVDQLKVLEQPANTAEGRLSVLDVRDKRMRQNVRKQCDLASAKGLYGTCQDMCPEKERYKRFARKCLGLFEEKSMDTKTSLDISNLDHRLIIKEYSRSSADQEEPLPHELRPSSTLCRTMDYILCNIMDNEKAESSVGEWYDFIWNRTRAIRKDITQQNLRDMSSVQIVEKCTRFHIHCASALCNEDITIFDPKINDENLTKCLQTLKHMYHDLLQKNIKCPNEPEFRAYDLLLSLKEGDALSQVRMLRIDIRDTPEVQFAVDAAFTFTTNNYVRFFLLVEQASYLNACILHRYLSHIRAKAVQIILKAYCAPNKIEQQYSVEDIWRLLKFDSPSDAVEFCQILGYKVEDQWIYLDRMASVAPPLEMPSGQSLLVEGKKNSSLAEIINAGPLSVNPLQYYSPHNSFDHLGYLKKESYEAQDQIPTAGSAEQIILESSLPAVQFQAPSTSNIAMVEVAKQAVLPPLLFGKQNRAETTPVIAVVSAIRPRAVIPTTQVPVVHRISTPQRSISSPSAQSLMFAQKIAAASKLAEASTAEKESREKQKYEQKRHLALRIYTNVLATVAEKEIRSIAKDVFLTEKMLELEKKKTALAKRESEAANEVANTIMLDFFKDEVKKIYKEELSAIRAGNIIRSSIKVSGDLIERVVAEDTLSIARETHKREHKHWMARLEDAKQKMNLVRVKKAILMWRRASRKRRRLEACRNIFPSCPPLVDKMSSKSPPRNPASGMSIQKQASHLLDAGVLSETIKEEMAWHPYDLSSSFHKALNNRVCLPKLTRKTYFWKLLLLCEEDNENEALTTFTRWLNSKFTKGFVKQDIVEDTCICSLYWLTNSAGDRIAVCIRSVRIGPNFQDTLSHLKKKSLLNGTCGIFFCAQHFQKQGVPNAVKALKQLLVERTAAMPIPLCCFEVGDKLQSNSELSNAFNLLSQQELLKDYHSCPVLPEDEAYSLSGKVLHAFEWLLMRCPEFPECLRLSVKHFIQDGIISVFNVVYQDLTHKKSRDTNMQDPHCIIEFFNRVMQLRAMAVESGFLHSSYQSLPEVARPVNQSKTLNSNEELSEIIRKLNSVILPSFEYDPTDPSSAQLYVEVVSSIFKRNSPQFTSNVQHFLTKAFENQKRGCIEIPWADVMYECVQYAAWCQNFSDTVDVEYIQDELENLDYVAEWLEIQMSYPSIPKTFYYDEEEEDVDESIEKSLKRKREDEEEVITVFKRSPKDARKLNRLEEILLYEKQESVYFLNKLETSASFNMSEGASMLVNTSWDSSFAFESSEFSEIPARDDVTYSVDLLERVKLLRKDLDSEKRSYDVMESSLKGLLI